MQKNFKGKLRFKDETGKDYPKWEEKKMNGVRYEHRLNNTKIDITKFFQSQKKGLLTKLGILAVPVPLIPWNIIR